MILQDFSDTLNKTFRGQNKWTLDDLHAVISKNDNDCDGAELHLKFCWKTNNSKSIFRLTGIDVSHMLPPCTDVVN